MSENTSELLTVEQFAQLPSAGDEIPELLEGRVYRPPIPGFAHGECVASIGSLVLGHVKANRLGRCSTRCCVVAARNPDSVLCPDLSFWSFDRPPDVAADWPTVPPRLVVEVVATVADYNFALLKFPVYLAFGVDLLWLVHVRTRSVVAMRLAEQLARPSDYWDWRQSALRQSQRLTETATLDGGDVLPGFSCKVSELFA